MPTSSAPAPAFLQASRAGIVAAALLSAACQTSVTTPPKEAAPATAVEVDPVKQVEAWRAKHEADYRREWVTIAGLHFLEPGAHVAGSDPKSDIVLPPAAPKTLGRFVLEGGAVRFEPSPGAVVLLKDQPVTQPIVLKDDEKGPGDELAAGSIKLVVHASGTRKTLRVWDPDGQQVRDFRGFTWFPIQADYRVTGRFIPDTAAKDLRVTNTFGDLDAYKTEGVVEFTLQGQTIRLRPFTTRPKRFYFVFRDASSGTETYEAARFLYSDLRDDGTTVLDFNQAYNPPCAFNPYTTCPIPLPENRLQVKVLAGERAYPVHVPLPQS